MKTLFITKDGQGVYLNSDKGEIKTEQNFKYRLNIRGIYRATDDMEVRFEDDSKKVPVYKVNKGDVVITFYDNDSAIIINDKEFDRRINAIVKRDKEIAENNACPMGDGCKCCAA